MEKPAACAAVTMEFHGLLGKQGLTETSILRLLMRHYGAVLSVGSLSADDEALASFVDEHAYINPYSLYSSSKIHMITSDINPFLYLCAFSFWYGSG
jgi:hypothetical protein